METSAPAPTLFEVYCPNEWCDSTSTRYVSQLPIEMLHCPRCGIPQTRNCGIDRVYDYPAEPDKILALLSALEDDE